MRLSSRKPLARASRWPSRSKTAASTVENQIVIAPYLVDIRYGQAILLSHVAQHALPQDLLAGDEWRRRKVHDGLRARFGKHLDGVLMITPALPEILIVPNVFADTDAQTPAVQLQNLRAHGWLEIPVLIENVIGGEQSLVKRGAYFAILQQDRAIEQRAAHV